MHAKRDRCRTQTGHEARRQDGEGGESLTRSRSASDAAASSLHPGRPWCCARTWIVLGILAVLWSEPAQADEVSAHDRARAALWAGRPADALATSDSLLALDLTDLVAGYVAARAEDLLGRTDRARMRYLDLEGAAPGEKVAELARIRRRDLEWKLAEQQDSLRLLESEPGNFAPMVALFPLEPLGGESDPPYFGLIWSYLLFEGLRGAGLAPAPIASTLLVQERLAGGQAVRAPSDIGRKPINTSAGVRARLAAIPDRDGKPYLESAAGEWDAGAREAIERFQADHGLPVTGDADLTTLSTLDRALDRWIERAPKPLPPNLVPRAMELLGAAWALRGTYRLEGSRVVVQLFLLSPDGQSSIDPIILRFPIDQTTTYAFEAARRLASAAGTRLASGVEAEKLLDESALELAARTLVILDRGLPRIPESRWAGLPARVQDWRLVESARAWSELSSAAREDLEREVLSGWTGARIDPALGMEAIWNGLDRDAWGEGGFSGAGAYGIIGTIGTVRVRGSR